jgi:HEAT repeat protein
VQIDDRLINTSDSSSDKFNTVQNKTIRGEMNMQANPHLLTDEQMVQFITQGYLVLYNELPNSLHEKVMGQIHNALKEEGNPGNNILPRVPDIQKFFETPIVKGALTSILGPDYYLHPHRHCHYNPPQNQKPGGGEWHKDGYWSAMRSHRPWWAMIFYYTQPITEDLGPTAIMPGTQYNEKFPGHDKEFLLPTGPAGTMVLVHFDLWHKASLNKSNSDRYMLKFQFARLKAPTLPSWNNRETSFRLSAGHNESLIHLWSDIWNWLRGDRTESTEIGTMEASKVVSLIEDPSEDVALNAVYKAARMGDAGVRVLYEIIRSGSNLLAQRAAYGLQASGAAAITSLIELLDHSDDRRRALACFVLGMIGDLDDRVPTALIQSLSDESEWVRRNAAEALGMMAAPSGLAVSALAQLLEAAVSNETTDAQIGSANAYSPNQDYIQNKIGYAAALSLLRIGKHGDAFEVVKVLELALSSNDRYVRAYAFEALSSLRTGEAVDVLIRYHRTARWCPDTHKASMF